MAQFWAGFVTDGQHVSIQEAEVGHDVTSDISSTLKGGGVEVMLVDVVNGCQTDQVEILSGGRSVRVKMFSGHSVKTPVLPPYPDETRYRSPLALSAEGEAEAAAQVGFLHDAKNHFGGHFRGK